MPDQISQARQAPPKRRVGLAFFSADNEAAVHLFDLIKAETSSRFLTHHEEKLGYYLAVKSSSRDPRPNRPWLIGAGPSQATLEENSPHRKPGILLCPPGKSRSAIMARQSFDDLHAAFEFHADSNILSLTTYSKRPIIYKEGDVGNKDLKLSLLERKSCVIRHRRNVLWIGEYRFILEFLAQRQNAEAKIEPHGYHGLYPSPLAYPDACSRVSWNVWLQDYIPGTSVISGVNIYTGEPVAVKSMVQHTILRMDTTTRLEFASQYGKSLGRGVLGIIDTWCAHGMSPPCFFNKQENSIRYCHKMSYSMPLAKYSFAQLPEPFKGTQSLDHIRICYQTLLGLADLHQKNICHGNIHPNSLLIFTTPESGSLNAVISLGIKPPKKLNTSIYIAPELLKEEDSVSLDEYKLDIWGLAASWLSAFFQVPKDQKMDEQLYATMFSAINRGVIKGWYKRPFADLLQQMLAFNPEERPIATMALAHEAWQPIREANGKRKRQDTNTKSKKVRWV